MPSDPITLPQLPPLPPQTPFVADNYPWARHYPQSSWEPSPKVESGRGKSTSPGSRVRALPSPPSMNAPPTSFVDVVSPPPRSQSRTHSRSRSGGRVPVLPSASSAEPIVISPPVRTHSRSTSAALPTVSPRPPAAEPAAKTHSRSKSRPLPLPLPPKDMALPTNQIPVRSESIPASVKPTLASAPAASQSTSHNASPRVKHRPEAVPVSAPARKPQTVPQHPRAILVSVSAERSFLTLDSPPPIPASAPVRAPTPPRPKLRPGLPATPRRQDNNGGGERGRSAQSATATMRSSPSVGPGPSSSSRATRAGEDYARKWVLEKKGKRLTQDTMVVAQQLRLLR
ncbi:hypothetical protein ACG7TL_004441 [Trametes sanguinea]